MILSYMYVTFCQHYEKADKLYLNISFAKEAIHSLPSLQRNGPDKHCITKVTVNVHVHLDTPAGINTQTICARYIYK